MSYYKYPRTPHLPWSKSRTADDIDLKNVQQLFHNKNVIVTEKMDGENTTLYPDHYHARSIDSKYHPSRSYVKQLHGHIQHLIPEGYRICGENMFAKHSILYNNLESYFYVFAIFDDNNICLSFEDTKKMCDELGLVMVPILYDGLFDINKIKAININSDISEGYVMRNKESFSYESFANNVAKFVRKNHVQTDDHWLNQQITPNKLKSKK